MSKYIEKEEINDERSLLANFVYQLIIDKYLINHGSRDYSKICFIDQVALSNEVTKAYNYMYAIVRNIYELYDREIPLGHLYELLINGKDNYGYTDDEYQEELKITRYACMKYYNYKY